MFNDQQTNDAQKLTKEALKDALEKLKKLTIKPQYIILPERVTELLKEGLSYMEACQKYWQEHQANVTEKPPRSHPEK